MKKQPTPFERYVILVNGRANAAKRLDISRGMVDHIINGIRGVSVRIAKQVSADTGGLIGLHELRPDIWAQNPTDKAA